MFTFLVEETETSATNGSFLSQHEDAKAEVEDEACDFVDTEAVIERAVSLAARSQSDSTLDLASETTISDFLAKQCGCQLSDQTCCSAMFSPEDVSKSRLEANELTRGELDLVILGKLAACTQLHNDSKNTYTSFVHCGVRVCRKMFMFLHDIGNTRLRNLIKHLRKHGIAPRVHGNKSRKPKNVLSLETVKSVVAFIVHYSEQNSLPLPGRIPGYHKSDIQLLPSSVSKKSIWELFQAALQTSHPSQPVAYTTFCRLWRTLLPNIINMKPMSDLCWTCQKNNGLVLRSANRSESEKSQALKDALEHLWVINVERQHYKNCLDKCKSVVHCTFTVNGKLELPPFPRPPASLCVPVHYSFDMAQQVHFPFNPQEPGPMYLLTCRKCSIFGVCCESIPRQVNFLTDEAADCGKGANAVISRLHYFFEHYGLGEEEAHLHADNCVGQNKNNAMMQYLMWRIMAGLHRKISISFLVVGHTKFSPDWCFGLFKRRFRRTHVTSLQDISETVDKSATCNVAQLVADHDGTILVPTYDWKAFLTRHFKTIPSIKRYHQFTFSCEKPGIVSIQDHADTEPQDLALLKDIHSNIATLHPPIIHPKGLSADRQWYLFDQIRQFCPEETQDLVCPLPSMSRSRSRPASTDAANSQAKKSHSSDDL